VKKRVYFSDFQFRCCKRINIEKLNGKKNVSHHAFGPMIETATASRDPHDILSILYIPAYVVGYLTIQLPGNWKRTKNIPIGLYMRHSSHNPSKKLFFYGFCWNKIPCRKSIITTVTTELTRNYISPSVRHKNKHKFRLVRCAAPRAKNTHNSQDARQFPKV